MRISIKQPKVPVKKRGRLSRASLWATSGIKALSITHDRRISGIVELGGGEAVKNEQPIWRSLEIIENRIAEKLTVEDIASSVYFSKYHYQRLFRALVGESVMEYVTKRRLTLAGRALRETDATILEIALQYGYDSREGFTRSFKAFMGVTPSHFRAHGATEKPPITGKGKQTMSYSKTTDEIIRELNDYIMKARDWANSARAKKNARPAHDLAWESWADDTEELADRVQAALDRVSAMAESPDEITNRFAIISIIDSVAFETNVTTLIMLLCMVGREPPESAAQNRPYCDSYRELAVFSGAMAKRVGGFLQELAALIFDDMRKTAAQKVQNAIQAGHLARDNIQEYALYIKEELGNLVAKLSHGSMEKLTVSFLDDVMLQLRIIMMAAKVDVFRQPESKPMFEGMKRFMDSLTEAADFCREVPQPDDQPRLMEMKGYLLDSILFQSCVLLFLYRSEKEKMGAQPKRGSLLTDAQQEILDRIEENISGYIGRLHQTGSAAFAEAAASMDEIAASLKTVSGQLTEHGGALAILADQFETLGDKTGKAAEV
jgi:AraC-like DNA-binding protein